MECVLCSSFCFKIRGDSNTLWNPSKLPALPAHILFFSFQKWSARLPFLFKISSRSGLCHLICFLWELSWQSCRLQCHQRSDRSLVFIVFMKLCDLHAVGWRTRVTVAECLQGANQTGKRPEVETGHKATAVPWDGQWRHACSGVRGTGHSCPGLERMQRQN